jgi:hypothetical protein
MKSKTALQPHHHVQEPSATRIDLVAPGSPLTRLPNRRISGTLSRGTNKSRHSGGNHPVTLATSLGRFVADLSPRRLPEEEVRIARTGFIDSIGATIAGRNEHAGDSAVPANVLFERLGALPIDARDLTARL